MKQKNIITKEQHLEMGSKIRKSYNDFNEVKNLLWKTCGKSHKINKAADKLEMVFNEFKIVLDDDYHNKINDAEFKEYGNIYHKSDV